MIEFTSALTVPELAPTDLLSLIPSIEISTPETPDFNFHALLTEFVGTIETAVKPEVPSEPQKSTKGEQEAQNIEVAEETVEKDVEGKETLPQLPTTPLVPFVPFVSFAPFVVTEPTTVKRDVEIPAAEVKQPTNAPVIEPKHWQDVRKYEFTVRYEPIEIKTPATPVPATVAAAAPQAHPVETSEQQSAQQLEPQLTVQPAAQATTVQPAAQVQAEPPHLKLQPIHQARPEQPKALITTDAIANVQQQGVPEIPQAHRILSIDRAAIDLRLSERARPAPLPLKSEANTTTTPFSIADLTKEPTIEQAEIVRPAHHVEIPVMPSLQTVRTISMQVGEADSEVTIRLEERGGDVKLKIDAANEPLRNELESSVDLLVQGLEQEEIPVSRIELGHKSLITKIRRMKEAK